jgi:hypothetical protein
VDRHTATDTETHARHVHPSARVWSDGDATPGPSPVGPCCASCGPAGRDPLRIQAAGISSRSAGSLLNAQSVRPTNHGTQGRPGRFHYGTRTGPQSWRRNREEMDAPPVNQSYPYLPGRPSPFGGE